ncbi:Cysteine proteinases superfamily protein [Euphorbia peplus]|nr:Cysteine proteinases superfamily protein [Euphorbia peplus]
MTRPSGINHRLSVYDFSLEDEQVEKTSQKLLGRYRQRKRKRDLFTPPITKYDFLHHFSGCTKLQEKESINEPIVIDDEPTDVDARQGIQIQYEETSDGLVDIKAKVLGHSDKVSFPSPICLLNETGSIDDISHLNVAVQSSSSNCENKSLGMITNDDGGIELGSLSKVIPILEEDEVLSTDLYLEGRSAGHEIEILDDEVVISPDCILYEDTYHTESHLTFSTSCIRIECPTVNGSKGTFNAEWANGDIISIESKWSLGIETAMVNLYFKPKISEGIACKDETAGNDKLMFLVYDRHWPEIQEAIESLDARYKDLWKVVFNSDMVKDDNDFTGPNSTTISKHDRYALDETFDEVLYPKGDPNAVPISWRDVDLLQPKTFINDTIIDFYVQFLKNKIQPEDNRRFHFFNSFFFRKLADLDKNPSSASDGRAAFQRVFKWTRKVNLFEKDFIFIPVNYSLHWSLIVICHPCEIMNFGGKSKDEASDSTLRVPCILHMDSIRGSHRGLKNLIQSYLCEEWKERQSEILDDVSSKFSCLRFIPFELPQQGNSFDCGLFVLHYLERFLEEVPVDFNPFAITQSSRFLTEKWFPPEEASLKRTQIRMLMCEIMEDHSQKIPQLVSIHENPCSKYAAHIDERETEVEFLEDICPLKDDSSGPCTPHLGIGSSLMLLRREIEEPGFGYRDLFEQGTRTRLFADENYMHVGTSQAGFLSPIEEVEEPGEQNLDSSSASEDSYKTVQLLTESPTSTRNSAHVNEVDVDSTSCESQPSSEIELDDDHSVEDFEGFVCPTENNRQESKGTNGPDSPSTSIEELTIVEDSQEDLTACIVEDSEEVNSIQNENGESLSDAEFDRMNSIICKDKVQTSDANLASESGMQAAQSCVLKVENAQNEPV